MEKDDEVWKSLNCVWKPNEIDPPHVNLMKKAEITCADGNDQSNFQKHNKNLTNQTSHQRYKTTDSDSTHTGSYTDSDHVYVGTDPAKFYGRR